jgi:hypothetical protein
MKKEKMVKHKKKAVIFIVCFVVLIIGVSIYFIFGHSPRKDFGRGSFQPLDKETQNTITSFFESSPSYSDIENYCKENPNYCMNYCREINPHDENCVNVMNFTKPLGNFTRLEGDRPQW